MTIRVVLAEDQSLLRATFRLLLDATADIEVVGEAGTGAEAIEAVRGADDVDVVVMDIRMPDVDGIEATRRITSDDRLAGVRILILTTFEHDDLVVDAIRAGASGFLGKSVEPGALLDAIRTIAAGERLLSPVATRALFDRVLAAPARRGHIDGVDRLTARERQVVELVARGLSNTEIAAQLHISAATAKTHVNRAMTKLAARDRAQLVVFAYEAGVVDGMA